MSPIGTFEKGQRKIEYSTENILPVSGRLIPEFHRRRNIKDMFFRNPSITQGDGGSKTPVDQEVSSGVVETRSAVSAPDPTERTASKGKRDSPEPNPESVPSAKLNSNKRPQKSETRLPLPKRSKSTLSSGKATPVKGQQNLKGFFKPKQPAGTGSSGVEKASADGSETPSSMSDSQQPGAKTVTLGNLSSNEVCQTETGANSTEGEEKPTSEPAIQAELSFDREGGNNTIIDPIVSKESWSKLFTKKAAPRCEDHDEPCITLVTKKPGINRGRSFWICSRPIGPSGNKERGTEWRCSTFIWGSDWNGP